MQGRRRKRRRRQEGGHGRSMCIKHIAVVVRLHVRRPEIARLQGGRCGCGIALANTAFDLGIKVDPLTSERMECMVVCREHLTSRKGFTMR